MMNNAVTIRNNLQKMQPEFKKALPAHIPAEKFVRTVQTAIMMNPQIEAACQSEGGMQSFLSACTNAAKDGLILDGKEAALVTFRSNSGTRNKPVWEERIQYIPMVAGLLKKARNSGEISSIAAHVVFENDRFTYVLGDNEHIEHVPKFADRGQPVAVYAIARLTDGSIQREVMDREAVMAIASQSKNSFQYDPDKGRNFGEWWRKTVIRRIAKYLPSSSDRDGFAQAVERIDEDFDFTGDSAAPEALQTQEPSPLQPKQRGAGAAAFQRPGSVAEHGDRGPVIDADFTDLSGLPPQEEAGSRAPSPAGVNDGRVNSENPGPLDMDDI